MELLRGAADRERQAGLPPRARSRLQGSLPALQVDVRLRRPAQGRLGLPRAAGRAGGREAARHHLQGGDRELRHRRVQRALPGVGLRLRRGLEPDGRADRAVDRPRRPLHHHGHRLHRVGLVVAEAALGVRAALPGPQGRSLLPAMRDCAQLPRGGAGLQGRRRSVGLRAAAGHRPGRLAAAGRRRAAGLDDDAVDADRPRRGRGGRRRRVRAVPGSGFKYLRGDPPLPVRFLRFLGDGRGDTSGGILRALPVRFLRFLGDGGSRGRWRQ